MDMEVEIINADEEEISYFESITGKTFLIKYQGCWNKFDVKQ